MMGINANMRRNFQFSIFNFQLKQNNPLVSGFTLIELIIVIAILGVLASTLIMTLNPADQYAKAVDAKRKLELSQIQRALESYYQDHNGSYPLSNAEYKIQDATLGSISWGAAWGSYIPVLPKDPGSGKNFVYYSIDGRAYYLYASLDRATDPDICQGLVNGECSSLPVHNHTLCGTGNMCNYGVSSPNVNP
jgi:prepilin-type N-terminal cleavage/methylation domain-containing protein